MISRDQMSGLFWLGISIFVCFESIRAGSGTFHSPGPGFLPFWAGTVLGTFAMILIVTNILKKQKEITNLWKGVEWSKVILVFASLLIYATLFAKVGYLITTFGLMAVLLGVVERRKIWIQGVTALITALVTYFVFYKLLGVQLPKGILDF